jgi:hypothetical protein
MVFRWRYKLAMWVLKGPIFSLVKLLLASNLINKIKKKFAKK